MGASVGGFTMPMSGGQVASMDINPQTGGSSWSAPMVQPTTGGKGGGQPISQAPTAGSPMARPVSGGNVFQQAQQGLTQGMGAQQAAMAGAQREMGFTPIAVRGTSYNPSMGDQRISTYMNPYEAQVIGNLQSDVGRAMDIGASQLGAQASRAGAFGGSRHGIAQGQMMGDALRGLTSTAGQLRQQGFNTALQASQADAAARNQAAQFAATQGMSAQQANQQAQLAGSQQRLGAASNLAGFGTNLGNLGQMGFNMGRQLSQDSMQQGLQQQLLNQALIDAAKGQYQGYQNAPATALGFMGQALGSTPNVSSTTQSRDPGLFDYLTMGATAMGGR